MPLADTKGRPVTGRAIMIDTRRVFCAAMAKLESLYYNSTLPSHINVRQGPDHFLSPP